jgi:hypothetical protein
VNNSNQAPSDIDRKTGSSSGQVASNQRTKLVRGQSEKELLTKALSALEAYLRGQERPQQSSIRFITGWVGS